MEIQNRISLEDDFTYEILEIIERTRDFQKQVQEAKERIDQLNRAKIAVDNREAIKNISETKRQINDIKKNVAIVIAAKDSATESIRKIKGEAKMLVSRPFTAIFKAKDEISGIINGITDKIFSLKTLAVGIMLGGAGKGIYDFTLGQAVKNEGYQTSLRTVLNDPKKGDEALSWSYATALKTPFRADDVVKGVLDLATSQIDYKKFLMPLGNLAAVKNKPLDQATFFMSKLSAGSMGDAVMQGRDLGISNEMWQKAGMTFDKRGEMQNTPAQAMEAFLQIMKNNHWDKLMDAKANTADGLMSNIADTGLSFGRALGGIDKGGQFVSGGPFEVFKKQLVTIQPLMDKLYASEGFKKLTKDVSDLVAAGGDKFTTFLKTFEDPKKVTEYENQFNQFIKDIKAGWEVAKEFGKAMGTIGTALKPVFSLVSEHPKLFTDLFLGIGAAKIGGSLFKGGFDSFKNIKEIIKEFPKLDSALKTMIKSGGGGLQGVFKLPFTGLKEGFGFVKDMAKWVPGLFSITGKNIVSTFKGGQNVIKDFFGLFPKGAKSAISALNTFKGTLKGFSLIKPLQDAFAGFKNLGVMKELPKALSAAFSPLRTVFSTLGNVIKVFSSGAVKVLRTFFTVIAANPVVAIIIGIIAVAILLYEAWTHNWGGIRDKTHEVIEFCKGKIESIKETFENVKKKFIEFGDEIKKKWEEWKKFFSHPIDAIINTKTNDTGNGLGVSTKVTVPGKNALGTNNWMGGLTWVGENGPEIIELPAGSKVYSNSKSMSMVNAMKKPMNTMLNGASSTMSNLSSQFLNWGKDMPDNLAKGIDSAAGITTNSITAMANKIRRIIHFTKPDEGPLKDSDTYGVDMVKGFGDGVKNNMSYSTNAATLMATNTKNVISDFVRQSASYGQNMVMSIAQGVQDSESSLTNVVKELTDKVITQFKEGFGIHSPSVVMHQIGGHLLQGLINGMSSKDIKGFMDKQIGSIIGAFSGSSGAVSGSVTEWLTQALMLTGTPLDWLPGLQKLVMAESGGDPSNWNPQSVGGEHATGLLQTLPSTFSEFAQQGMRDIMNPIHNTAAAINYIKRRYGSVYNTPLFRGGPYAGYALGTSYSDSGWHWVGENGPELMKLPGGTQIKDNFTSMKMAKSLMQPLQSKKFSPLLNKDNTKVTVNLKKDTSKQKPNVTIAKLADQIIVREDADIDKIATALAKKLKITAFNM